MSQKQRKDAVETAELIRRGTPAAPIRTNTDGGMHKVFRDALKGPSITDSDGKICPITFVAAPGTIPSHVNPPSDPNPVFAPEGATGAVPEAAPAPASTAFAGVPLPRPAPQPKSGGATFGVASAHASPAPPPQPARPAAPPPVAWGAPPPGAAAAVPGTRALGLRGSEPKPAATASPAKPTPPKQQATAEASPPARTASKQTMPGAQPTVPAGSFDSRWGAFR